MALGSTQVTGAALEVVLHGAWRQGRGTFETRHAAAGGVDKTRVTTDCA
jgi:hypothetical protein